jgi:predicted transcriptional regulator
VNEPVRGEAATSRDCGENAYREKRETMNVQITPEQEARFSDLASRTGKNAEELVQEAVTRFLDEEDARFYEAVKLGEAALARGEFLTHEQAGERLERLRTFGKRHALSLGDDLTLKDLIGEGRR